MSKKGQGRRWTTTTTTTTTTRSTTTFWYFTTWKQQLTTVSPKSVFPTCLWTKLGATKISHLKTKTYQNPRNLGLDPNQPNLRVWLKGLRKRCKRLKNSAPQTRTESKGWWLKAGHVTSKMSGGSHWVSTAEWGWGSGAEVLKCQFWVWPPNTPRMV